MLLISVYLDGWNLLWEASKLELKELLKSLIRNKICKVRFNKNVWWNGLPYKIANDIFNIHEVLYLVRTTFIWKVRGRRWVNSQYIHNKIVEMKLVSKQRKQTITIDIKVNQQYISHSRHNPDRRYSQHYVRNPEANGSIFGFITRSSPWFSTMMLWITTISCNFYMKYLASI